MTYATTTNSCNNKRPEYHSVVLLLRWCAVIPGLISPNWMSTTAYIVCHSHTAKSSATIPQRLMQNGNKTDSQEVPTCEAHWTHSGIVTPNAQCNHVSASTLSGPDKMSVNLPYYPLLLRLIPIPYCSASFPSPTALHHCFIPYCSESFQYLICGRSARATTSMRKGPGRENMMLRPSSSSCLLQAVTAGMP